MPAAGGGRCVSSSDTHFGDGDGHGAAGATQSRDNGFWLRLAVGGLIICLLMYGCWQVGSWFAASFPKDFR
ncbi:hypothetical protein MPAR168_12285 [Methylorubrum populi]|uniref:Uncharacterized protein n=1 Tax=Methylobacterium radiotolerans TaxID=31998 RepID=A0ABU7TDG2_9HYPH